MIPYFAFPPALRRAVYTTNQIESLNSVVRKAIRVRGHFPDDESARKLVYLAIRNHETTWKRPMAGWYECLAAFHAHFSDRLTRQPRNRIHRLLTVPGARIHTKATTPCLPPHGVPGREACGHRSKTSESAQVRARRPGGFRTRRLRPRPEPVSQRRVPRPRRAATRPGSRRACLARPLGRRSATRLDPEAIIRGQHEVEVLRAAVDRVERGVRTLHKQQTALSQDARKRTGDELHAALIESNQLASDVQIATRDINRLISQLDAAEQRLERALSIEVPLPNDLEPEKHQQLLAEALGRGQQHAEPEGRTPST